MNLFTNDFIYKMILFLFKGEKIIFINTMLSTLLNDIFYSGTLWDG